MSYKISKELFEAVMDEKVTTEISISPYYNEINGCEENDLILINYNFVWIPLNTFFFKCKEWAYNQGYIIYSSTKSCSMFKKEAQLYCSNENIQEQQKIFDACQWILDNKDKR